MSYYRSSLADCYACVIFLVVQDEHGHHFVHENHGLIGGDFVTREEALRLRAAKAAPRPVRS